jgi:lipopolysaccharide transport system ATP-binding protein
MEDVAESGRTVIFVSHNMQAVRSLCTRVVELTNGRVTNSGPAARVVDDYLKQQWGEDGVIEWLGDERPGDDEVRLSAVRVLDADWKPTPVVVSSQPFRVQIDLELARVPFGLVVGFDLAQADGSVVFRTYQTDASAERWPELRIGRNRLQCEVVADLLNAGRYTIQPRISIDRVRWIVHQNGVSFDVQRDPGDSPHALAERPGAIAPLLIWRRENEAS